MNWKSYDNSDYWIPESFLYINGIYTYIGKTKRNLETRVKEHFRNIKNGETEKSAVAAHVWKEKHAIDHKPVLSKQASNKHKLKNGTDHKRSSVKASIKQTQIKKKEKNGTDHKRSSVKASIKQTQIKKWNRS